MTDKRKVQLRDLARLTEQLLVVCLQLRDEDGMRHPLRPDLKLDSALLVEALSEGRVPTVGSGGDILEKARKALELFAGIEIEVIE